MSWNKRNKRSQNRKQSNCGWFTVFYKVFFWFNNIPPYRFLCPMHVETKPLIHMPLAWQCTRLQRWELDDVKTTPKCNNNEHNLPVVWSKSKLFHFHSLSSIIFGVILQTNKRNRQTNNQVILL